MEYDSTTKGAMTEDTNDADQQQANGHSGHDPAHDAGSSEFADGDPVPVADPMHPADQELTAAVEAAQVGPYMPGGKFQPPNTTKILVFVLLAIAGGFLYFIFVAGTGLERTDKIRQKLLETRLFQYEKQQAFVKSKGFLPAGKTYKPLTQDEQAELAGLREKYGRMKVVDPDAPKEEATAPATVP
jgi:hypothetical protein